MKKVCWLLILVLLLGYFVGCQQAPGSKGPIENEDGTQILLKLQIRSRNQKRKQTTIQNRNTTSKNRQFNRIKGRRPQIGLCQLTREQIRIVNDGIPR